MESNTNLIQIQIQIQISKLSKLSKETNDKFAQRLCSEFNTEEQIVFVNKFYVYLCYDQDEFVINLDDIWELMGYKDIEYCKDLLTNKFTKDVDYTISNNKGSKKKVILMTVDAFKKLCLKARKDEAEKLYDYYIKLEKLMDKIIKEEQDEVKKENEQLKTQLALKDEEIQIVTTQKEKTFLVNNSKKKLVYIGYAEARVVDIYGIIEKYGIGKFGISFDIERRLDEHKRNFGNNFTLEFVYASEYYIDIERKLKEDPEIIKRKVVKAYKNGQNQIELVQFDAEFGIEDLYKKILEIKAIVEDDYKKQLEKDLEEKNKELEEKNKEIEEKDKKIKEKDKEIKKKEKHIKKINKENFIARELYTGKETECKSYIQAAKLFHCGEKSLPENYIDKPRQNRGYVYYTKGKPYWEPPENFKFIKDLKSSTSMIPCKSIHKVTGEITYYNSIKEVAHIIYYSYSEEEKLEFLEKGKNNTRSEEEKTLDTLLDNFRKRIEDVVNGKVKSENNGDKGIFCCNWYKLASCGYLVYPNGTKKCVEEIEE
jgi:prophage antirepressor-like protein